jgi:hypothetical protein
MTAIEKNIADLIAAGWVVAFGPLSDRPSDGVVAYAIAEHCRTVLRAGDTASKALSILRHDLELAAKDATEQAA